MVEIIVSDEIAPTKNKGSKRHATAIGKIKLKKRVQIRKAEKETVKIKHAREKIKETKKALVQLENATSKPTAPKLITEEVLQVAPPSVQQELKDDAIFKPNPGPQTDFLASPELDVLYGGAAGGGKSYAMLVDPLRYADNPNHRALLLRRTMPELTELIDISKQLYRKAFPKAQFKEQEKRWIFPSGSSLKFSYCDSDSDVHQFQGQAYTWIGIDELTHYATPYVWNYLRSRLRTTDPNIKPYLRATTNPGGVGAWWVKKMYIDPAEPNTAFWAVDTDTGQILTYPKHHPDENKRGKPLFKRKFIPARLTDNPYLMQSDDYMTMLSSLPEVERKRLLEGDWDVSENSAFPEFSHNIHVIDADRIPTNWPRFRACDYGYTNPACVLWFAVKPNGTLIVYRELYSKGLNAEQLAYKVVQLESMDVNVQYGVLDTECWAKRGQVGPTIAEVMIKNGCNWRQADKGPGSRINGKMEVHRRLSIDPITKEPGVLIFRNCSNLIRTMSSLPLDDANAEDVDTKSEDHAYDALRYGFASRPKVGLSAIERALQIKRETYRPMDPVFGY